MVIKITFTLLQIIFIIQIIEGIPLKEAKVEIINGVLNGFENGDYYGFRGIPYAEPPIGDNRFESPKPYTEKWTTPYNATRKDIICAQLNPGEFYENFTVVGTEDCLYLNVYVPKLNEKLKDENNTKLLPVMVYIHGGSFTYGSGTYLKERTLMRSKKFILVTLNYRLGPFGFLSTKDNIIAGNMGLKDQRLALEWIKDNINSFGGDINRILLSGFSSGAVSVDIQTMSPGIENLITTAVSFSGSALNPWSIKLNRKNIVKKFAKILKCQQYNSSEEIKTCLNKHNFNCILNAYKKFLRQNVNGTNAFGPIIESNNVEDAILTKHPNILLKEKLPNIPYLSSFTAQDGGIITLDLYRIQWNGKTILNQIKTTPIKYFHRFFYNDGINPTQNTKKRIRRTFRKYNLTIPLKECHFNNLNNLLTDHLFKNGILQTLKLRQNYSNIPVYSYVYDNPPLLSTANLISKRLDLKYGTTHGDDVFLFLNSPLRNLIVFREDEMMASKKLIGMLREFVDTGKPKFGETTFPESTSKSIKVVRIKSNGTEIEDM